MRAALSRLICQSAINDPRFVVISGDHGYALFDEIRAKRPDQFINAGVAEQAVVGLAAGLSRTGHKVLVYGLSAFIPIRVLEQIKLDICFSNLPVTFLGDGAGLVYSTLGASHHCAEDIACLRPLPNIQIYSPCDAFELESCYQEALSTSAPTYIRIGKSDRPAVHLNASGMTAPLFTFKNNSSSTCLVATGAMVSQATVLAKKFNVSAVSVPRVKPLVLNEIGELCSFKTLVTIEEGSLYGGLYSTLAELLLNSSHPPPRVHPIALKDKFARLCGSYQYALSEHDMSDEQLEGRIRNILQSTDVR